MEFLVGLGTAVLYQTDPLLLCHLAVLMRKPRWDSEVAAQQGQKRKAEPELLPGISSRTMRKTTVT